jgi:hypothetical protein
MFNYIVTGESASYGLMTAEVQADDEAGAVDAALEVFSAAAGEDISLAFIRVYSEVEVSAEEFYGEEGLELFREVYKVNPDLFKPCPDLVKVFLKEGE